jgi:hypothetical protein
MAITAMETRDKVNWGKGPSFCHVGQSGKEILSNIYTDN